MEGDKWDVWPVQAINNIQGIKLTLKVTLKVTLKDILKDMVKGKIDSINESCLLFIHKLSFISKKLSFISKNTIY